VAAGLQAGHVTNTQLPNLPRRQRNDNSSLFVSFSGFASPGFVDKRSINAQVPTVRVVAPPSAAVHGIRYALWVRLWTI
jgi:hypothetical protein